MKAIAREGNCLFSCLVVWSSGCFVVGAYDISFSKKQLYLFVGLMVVGYGSLGTEGLVAGGQPHNL